MKNKIFFSLVLLFLISGCVQQDANENPASDSGVQADSEIPVPRENTVREPVVSAEGRILDIDYVFTSATYGGFIKSVGFEVSNTGQKEIVIAVDYSIKDFGFEEGPPSKQEPVIEEIGWKILPSGNISAKESKTFVLQVPKERIRTGHNYKIEIVIRDTVTKKVLATLVKTQRLPPVSSE